MYASSSTTNSERQGNIMGEQVKKTGQKNNAQSARDGLICFLAGVENINGVSVYRVVKANVRQKAANNYDWAFERNKFTEDQIKNSIKNGIKWGNIGVNNGKIVGTAGSLDRFTKASNHPYIIISQISDGERVLGYKVANFDCVVRNISLNDMIAYGEKTSKAGGVPVQNAIFVQAKDGKRAFYRAYEGHPFIEEVVSRKQNTNAEVKRAPVAQNASTLEKAKKLSDVFTEDQIKQLKLGKKNGVDIRVYANKDLSAKQMEVLRKGLERGVNVRPLAHPEFNADIMEYYVTDLKNGANIKAYLNPKYNIDQLSEISVAYEDGLDITQMSDPKISAREMAEIATRLKLETWGECVIQSDKSWNAAFGK